jgi:uncharacterized lipoprotein YmbA
MNRLINLALAFGFVGFSLASCSAFSPRPDPSRFFTLTPLSQVEEIATKGVSNPAGISLGIGPISFPGYLDRQEIVTRVAQNQIAVSEHDRWAEPLDENFARVLAQNLSALLRAERINVYPWPIDKKPNYQVDIEVLRFEANAAGDVQLLARWAVRDTSKRNPPQYGDSRISYPARTKSTEASVAALSEALGALSREIGDAVGGIEGTKQGQRKTLDE